MTAGRVPEKAPDLLGHLLERAQCGQCDPLQIVACAHRLSGNALLDLLIDPLVGVEIGRVRWQEEQRDLAVEGREVFLDLAGLVNAVTIDHQIDLARGFTRPEDAERAEETGQEARNRAEMRPKCRFWRPLGASRRFRYTGAMKAPFCSALP